MSTKRAIDNLGLLAVFLESASTQILSDGVMVAHGPLEAIVMVRIHVGQPLLFKTAGMTGIPLGGGELTPFAGGGPELVAQHFQAKARQLTGSEQGRNIRDIVGADAAQWLMAGLPGAV